MRRDVHAEPGELRSKQDCPSAAAVVRPARCRGDGLGQWSELPRAETTLLFGQDGCGPSDHAERVTG